MEGSVGLRSAEVSACREKALREAEKWRDFVDIAPEALVNLARLYVSGLGPTPSDDGG